MASFHLLFLTLYAVSVYGYDLNTRQQYLPVQAYPYQNGYAVVYTTSQIPVRTHSLPTYPTYSYQSYPAGYAIPKYYSPYSYQIKDTAQKVRYPVRYGIQREIVPTIYEGQQVIYTAQQENNPMRQENQRQTYSSGSPYYQTKGESPKVLFPFRGYAQENAGRRQEQEYSYQPRDALSKVTIPVREYVTEQERPEQTYPYQMKQEAQSVPYPVYAPRYSGAYQQSVNQGYPMKSEGVSKRPNKPVIHVKYDSTRGYPTQQMKEEMMYPNRRDTWVSDEDYEKNAIQVDGNMIY